MRLRETLLVKLLVALTVPIIALFSVYAYVAYTVSRTDLDNELGRRLEAIAASAASQIRDANYLSQLSPGDEHEPLYEQAVLRLGAIAQATGAQLFLIDAQYASRGDTREAVAIGTPNRRAELGAIELAQVFKGKPATSVTFQGNDGRWYKTGYAPAFDADKSVVLAVGAEAPASYFRQLSDLRHRMVRFGAVLFLVAMLAALFATLAITRNVRRLASAAERIGAGDLRVPIKATTRDELGTLAETMERMRVQLAERDAKMQQMLAGIAHEVRNPLAGMTLFAGILRDEIATDDERRGHVLKIERELGYLERVVNDFLEYARRPKPELADVALPDLLAEVAQLASTPEVTVSVAPGSPAFARADGSQLRRALLNLARNAVQAATSAGHAGNDAVRLSAKHGGDTLVLTVWNRGKEISPEASGKLFEPFYTTREKGTGLGLAFARDIAADHGGKIEVASGNGETTFSIVLPV